jgi:hypothetical protein
VFGPERVEEFPQGIGEREHSTRLIFRGSRIEPDFALLAIDVAPL